MTKTLFTTEIRDTDSYDSPAIKDADGVVYQLVNGLNAAIDYEFQGTHDDDADTFDDAVTLGTGSIAADSTGREGLVHEPWDKVRIVVTAQSSPTSGTFSAYEHQ